MFVFEAVYVCSAQRLVLVAEDSARVANVLKNMIKAA